MYLIIIRVVFNMFKINLYIVTKYNSLFFTFHTFYVISSKPYKNMTIF